MTFWNVNINKFKCSTWTTFTGTTTTRTTNSHHFYHTIDRQGTGQGKGKDNRGSRSSRHDTSQASWYVFFFLSLNFYLLNVYLHLELPQWWWPATTTAHHLYPQNECRLETHLRLEFWYVKFFFCPLLMIIYFRLCVWNHNQDDDGERPPPLGQWTGTQDASSVSRVSGMFFYFIFLDTFFLFLLLFQLTSTCPPPPLPP